MSRPIIEPSNPREIGNTKFRTSQLERRPAPTLQGVSQYAWLYCSTGPTVTADTDLFIPWDTFWTTDTTVFAASPGGTFLGCNAPGSYIFEEKVLFYDVTAVMSATIVGTVISWLDGGDTAWFAANNWIKNSSPLGTAMSGVTELAIHDVATGYVRPSDGSGLSVEIRATNYDLVDHDVNVAYLKAVYVPGANELVEIFS